MEDWIRDLMMSETTGRVHDVIIVGAGPAGCALALSLSQCAPELSFLVINDAKPNTFKIGESLPPEATRILHHLHPSLPKILAEQVEKGYHVLSNGTASAWGSHELEERHSILNPFGHGWHLDRALFDGTLRQVLQNVCGETCLRVGTFTRLQKEGNHWTVEVAEAEVKTLHQARCIIDATGRKASVATKLGAKTMKHDNLLAFYAVFSSDSPDDRETRTLIESTPTGWWYTSLIPHHRRVVVYHTDSISQTAKFARRHLGFLDLLHEETINISSIILDHCYGIIDARETNFPQCVAAGSSSLIPFGDEEAHWYAVGDAAMAFDPLSAQGMMTALEMGFYLGRVLGARLTGRAIAGVAGPETMGSVSTTFEAVRAEYEMKRKYYYGNERRFKTSFWNK